MSSLHGLKNSRSRWRSEAANTFISQTAEIIPSNEQDLIAWLADAVPLGGRPSVSQPVLQKQKR